MRRGFTIEDSAATIPLNTSVCGDVTIVLYHARSTFGGKVQGKVGYLLFCAIFYLVGMFTAFLVLGYLQLLEQ